MRFSSNPVTMASGGTLTSAFDLGFGATTLGLSIGEMAPAPNMEAQTAILHSKDAIATFDDAMQTNDFMLTIERSE